MGAFESAPTRSAKALPEDLPDPVQAVKDGRPSGQAFRSDDGYLYRLNWPSWRLDTRAARRGKDGKDIPGSAPAETKPAEKPGETAETKTEATPTAAPTAAPPAETKPQPQPVAATARK